MVARFLTGSPSLERLRDDMDRLFDRVFEDLPRAQAGWSPRSTFPSINVWEDDRNVFAEAELPGLSMEEIDVTVVGNELTVAGKRKDCAEEGVTYHRRERGCGPFNRVVHLPVDIEPEKVEARLRNGVLLITLPKAAAALPRKVEVRVAGD